jgi:hypothetical protein
LKDIFIHPWVLEFEKEEKEKKVKNSIIEKNSSDINNKLANNILDDINKNDLKLDKLNLNNQINKKLENEESKQMKSIKYEEMDINANNSIYAHDNKLDIDDSNEKKKKKKKKKEIDTDLNLPNKEIQKNDDPFDNIMNQVQKRNKGKVI